MVGGETMESHELGTLRGPTFFTLLSSQFRRAASRSAACMSC